MPAGNFTASSTAFSPLDRSPPSAFTVPYDSFRRQLDSRKLDPSYEDTYATGGLGKNLSKDLDYDFICFFLSSHRVDLYRQIDLRCEEMLTGTLWNCIMIWYYLLFPKEYCLLGRCLQENELICMEVGN